MKIESVMLRDATPRSAKHNKDFRPGSGLPAGRLRLMSAATGKALSATAAVMRSLRAARSDRSIVAESWHPPQCVGANTYPAQPSDLREAILA
jgi:hypothetical protein